MKTSQNFTASTVCNLIGADGRTRFALSKKYKLEYSRSFWIEALKEYKASKRFQKVTELTTE